MLSRPNLQFICFSSLQYIFAGNIIFARSLAHFVSVVDKKSYGISPIAIIPNLTTSLLSILKPNTSRISCFFLTSLCFLFSSRNIGYRLYEELARHTCKIDYFNVHARSLISFSLSRYTLHVAHDGVFTKIIVKFNCALTKKNRLLLRMKILMQVIVIQFPRVSLTFSE